jgi:hypothetical protein
MVARIQSLKEPHMNLPISKMFLGAGLAVALGACASIPDPHLAKRGRLEQIHAGLTQDEVRSLAGKAPTVTGNKRTGETLWIYPFTDLWGYSSEFDVEFKGGVVTDTFSERLVD